jgi:cytochrome c
MEVTGMKALKIVVLMLIVLVVGAGLVFAMQHEASIEKGKALFNDPKLGTSGKTCTTCHAGGKGLEMAGTQSDLDKTINACITTPLKGKELNVKSVEMQSLLLYVKSIGEKKPAAKKPAVGC